MNILKELSLVITESTSELLDMMSSEKNELNKSKLYLLYLISKSPDMSMSLLTTMVNRPAKSIYRWMEKYRKDGLTSLLLPQNHDKYSCRLSAEELNILKNEMSKTRFNSRREVHKYVTEVQCINLCYSSICYLINKYKLKLTEV